MRTVPKTVLVLAIQITHSKLNRELVHLLQSILNYTGWKSSRNMRVTRNDAEAQQTFNCGTNVPPLRRVPKEFTELIERVYVHRDDLLNALRGDEGARPNAVRELGGVKNCLLFSICACHPCAGAMLIISVSFQIVNLIIRYVDEEMVVC